MNTSITKRIGRGLRGKKRMFCLLVVIGTYSIWIQTSMASSTAPSAEVSADKSDKSVDKTTKVESEQSSGDRIPEDLGATEDVLGDELLLFEDMPVVISASRQAQAINQLSVPVSLITAEDIHYSGLTSIPEMLQFVPGVDFIPLSRNRWAVGVRGLHDFTSDRTLTLINGRIADSPMFGGSEFYRLPVLPEDIERIEIVRGPGGAAWGANAFTGVINIITKKPEDVQGWFISNTTNEFGDSFSHLRWGAMAGKWTWRTSVGYAHAENSDDAGAGDYESNNPALNPLIGFSSFTARDYSRNLRFDGEAVYSCSDETQITLGLGYSHDEMGDFEFAGYYPRKNAWLETARPYVKVDHEFEDGSSGYLQWFGNFLSSQLPSLYKGRSNENDIEGQWNIPFDEHQLSVGGNVRIIHLSIDERTSQGLMMPGGPYDEQLAGMFVIDRWQMDDRITLEGQVRGDWYSETQTDWSSRLTGLYAIDEQKDHIVRMSWAKAFRAPLSSLREVEISQIDLGPMGMPGLNAFNVLPSDDLDNEETWSLEAGYTGKITEDLNFRLDGYYQRFSKLIGYSSLPDPMAPMLDRAFYQADNIDGADSYGCELEIEKKIKLGKVSAWYAYNDFQEDQSHQNVRAYAPAKHKAGIKGRIFLSDDWAFNTNYRYTNVTHPLVEDTAFDIPTNHRLDITISKDIAQGTGEFMIGVSDLLNKTEGPNWGVGQISAHEIPGRTFFARLQLNF